MTAAQPPAPAGDPPDYLRKAEDLQKAGDIARAVEVLRHGLDAARRRGLRSGGELNVYATLNISMVNLLMAEGEVANALRLTGDLRRRLRDAGYDGSELLVLANLINVHQLLDDLAAAEECAMEACRLWRLGAKKEVPSFPTPSAINICAMILDVARKAYYVEENYERSVAMAGLATELNPESDAGWRLLAFSRLRMGLLAESIVAFDAAISLNPEPALTASLHTGRAATFQRSGRLEEAIAAMTEAITLFPDRPHYYYSRAQLQSQAGCHEAALADLDQVLLLSDSDPVEDNEAKPEPQSRAEYIRDLSTADVRDFAGLDRLAELWALGRTKNALQAAIDLAAEGSDPPTRCSARRTLGTWYLELGDAEQGAQAFTTSIDEGFFVAEALLGRARCSIKLGRIDGALTDLEALCGQDSLRHDPAGAADVLYGLLDEHPELTSARLVLGHALLEAWRPAKAIQQFDIVLSEEPGSWQALLWRGMCQITHSGPGQGSGEDSDDEAWNSSLSLGRVWLAIADLVAATKAAPSDSSPEELLWIIDRVLLFDEIEGRLLDEALDESGLGGAITEALPVLASIFRRLGTAANAESQHDWTKAVAALALCRNEAGEAGLPIMAAMMDLRTADVLMRQFELQRALDHVAVAEMALARIGYLPGQDGLNGRVLATEGSARDSEPAEDPTETGEAVITVDFDHLEFSVAVTERFVRFTEILKAEALSRLGRPREALRQIHDLSRVIAEAVSEGRTSLALALIPILRDGGEYSQALALIEAIRPLVEDEHNRARLHGYEATIYVQAGSREKAEEILEAEIARTSSGPLALSHATAANLATALLNKNPARSLSLLDAFPPPDTESISGLSNWHVIRGQALLILGRPDEALGELTAGLDLRDQVRGRLRAEEARISWQAERLSVIELAIEAALEARNVEAALELSERGKARAFVDQLEFGHPQLTPEAADLVSAISRAQERKHLLLRLVLALTPGMGSQSADENAITIRELADRGLNLRLDDAPISMERVARLLRLEGAAIQRLEARFLEVSSGERESIAGKVASASDIGNLLQPEHADTVTRVLLAEYFISDEQVVLFLLGTGDTEVKARAIPFSETELRAIVEPWLRSVSQGRATDLDGLGAMSRLIEPLLEACAPEDLVCFVPHGILHHVPLHAVPAGGQPLIERNPVIYAPSASVVAQCRARRGNRPRSWHRALVLGDSRGDLPHAREEAMTVADLLGAQAYVGDAATRTTLSTLNMPGQEGPDVVHLACHGVFDTEQPLRSGILLAPRPGGRPDEAILTAEEVYGLRLRAGLVTLSACQSGLNVSAPGEELLGLTRAFMYAGAATVLVSLWPVDDLSTRLLMEVFYRRLIGTGRRTFARPAEALREAQVRLMTITAGEAIELVNARIARTADPTDRLLLLLDAARLHVMAGDLSAAVGVYTGLQNELAGQPSPLAESIDQRLRLIEFKAEAPTSTDYQIHPFEHPRYWSAFVAVGEWE